MRIALLAILSLAAASRAGAASYEKGLQLVLLQCFGNASRNALIAAIRDSGTKQVEIGSAPWVLDSCTALNNDPLGNLIAVIGGLDGIDVRVTIYLDSMLHNKAASSQLADRATTVYTSLMKTNAGNARVSFRLGGSLEDEYNDTALKSALTRIASGLTTPQYNTLKSQIAFRRSPNGGFGNSSYTQHRAWGINVPLRHESHGAMPRSGYPAWSNDGVFVAWPDNNTETCTNCNGSPLTLSNFMDVGGISVKMLWRPAYNLARVEVKGSTTNYVTKDAKRQDLDSAPKFGPIEAAVVKQFLKP